MSEAMSPTTHHRRLVADGACLLDVRTPAEFHEGHLPQATNVPLQDLSARLRECGPTSRPIVVYCRSGARSARASELLRAAGYQVRDIGSMAAW